MKKNIIILAILLFFFMVGILVLLQTDGAPLPWFICVYILVFSGFLGGVLPKQQEKKKAKERRLQRKQEEENLDIEKLDCISNYIKKHGEKTVYRISLVNHSCALEDSKFGGYPLWPKDQAYPISKEGEKLVLLAQINFSKEEFENPLLPKEGILQFFVLDNDYTGCNFFCDGGQGDSYQIVYHKQVEQPLSVEEIDARGIPTTATLPKDSPFPLDEERKISFVEDKDFPYIENPEYSMLLKRALQELYHEEWSKTAIEYFNYTELDYLWETYDTMGHKMLGYPGFTQSDPRGDDTPYDTVLLQMDSEDNIMWGDCGIANFFINSSKLKNLDFSDVMYTWDCC